MSENKSRMSWKRFSMLMIPAAAALMLVMVWGYNTFSNEKGDGPSITEYRKQGLLQESGRSTSKRPGEVVSPENANPVEVREDLSKAVLSVQKLSCSSCIQEIKAALASIQGIEDVLVDISRGTAQIYFDSKALTDPDRLAQAVTARGYPATLIKTYTGEELKKEEALAASRSQYYIASVAGWDVARSDLDTQLEHARRRYVKIYGEGVFSSPRGKSLYENLRAQIASRLIDEGVMMQEITKAAYRVDASLVQREVDKAVRESGKGLEDFKSALAENGMDFEYFKKRLENQLLITGYLEEKILSGASSEVERQSLFTSWFNNAKTLAEVSYYDKDLERLLQRQSAQGRCGG